MREETCCCHYMGYSFQLAPPHSTDSTQHSLCYTSCGALAGIIAQWVHHEGMILRPIAPWVNTITTELHLTPALPSGLQHFDKWGSFHKANLAIFVGSGCVCVCVCGGGSGGVDGEGVRGGVEMGKGAMCPHFFDWGKWYVCAPPPPPLPHF